jgi:hypothetical protein
VCGAGGIHFFSSKARVLELFSACAGVVLCTVLICRVIAVIMAVGVFARAVMEVFCNNLRCRRTKVCGVR